MGTIAQQTSFAKWRERLWPIRRYELKKFVPLLFMKFFISLSYGVLTSMKDALVVTARGGGAEVIPVLKGWVVLPIALGTALLYSKLANRFQRTTLFYGTILSFVGFILLYGFVLYPHLDALSPHASADWLLERFGEKNSHWVAIYRNWIQSLFFVMAELWGQVAIFLLFWGFVNQICNFQEAKRSYNLFIGGGDLAQIMTGPLVWYCTRQYISDPFQGTLQSLCLYVSAFGIAIMLLHAWILRYVLSDARLYQPECGIQQAESKPKLSLWDSLKFIVKSKYLLCIAAIVVAYGLTMSLVEVSWKANLKLAYPDTSQYQSFMATVSSLVGSMSLLITLFFSGPIIRSLGWRFCAQLPPIVIGVTSLLFLLLFCKQDAWLTPMLSWVGLQPILFIVIFGACQNISSKIMKYAFFDSTKEMAYIPLDQESKIKGKAAIDIVGSRLGKSGAAWIQILLIQLSGTGSVLTITPYLLPLIGATVLVWLFSVRALAQEIQPRQAPIV